MFNGGRTHFILGAQPGTRAGTERVRGLWELSPDERSLPHPPTEDLRTYFKTDEGLAKAVDGVSFEIPPGETLGVVGESGCGKSVTALSILRLSRRRRADRRRVDPLRGQGPARRSAEPRCAHVRGNEIAMIFQEPMTSLNPVYTVGDQIVEAVRLHQKKSRREARERAIEMLRARRHPVARDARRRVPAPALRRHAPARDDRDGARVRAAIC